MHGLLESPIPDAMHLVNSILNYVSTDYPGFDSRYKIGGVTDNEGENWSPSGTSIATRLILNLTRKTAPETAL